MIEDLIHEHQELRKLDARLAAVVGYTTIHQIEGINGTWYGDPPAGWVSEYGLKIPYFSSEWAAAGLLADWLREHGWGIEITTPIGGWHVEVAKTQFANIHGCSYAPTFAEALSRAVDNTYRRAAATL